MKVRKMFYYKSTELWVDLQVTPASLKWSLHYHAKKNNISPRNSSYCFEHLWRESRCLAFLLLLCILCPWQISLINHYNSIPQTLRVLHNTAFHAANQLEFTQGKNPCSSPWWFVILLYSKFVWNPHNTLYEHWTYRIRDLKGTLEII